MEDSVVVRAKIGPVVRNVIVNSTMMSDCSKFIIEGRIKNYFGTQNRCILSTLIFLQQCMFMG